VTPEVNHFDKLVLIDNADPSSYRLTLHLWRPPYTGSELRDELIHDHRFNFWSAILAGVLVSESFVQSDAGSAFRQYHYVPELRSMAFRDFYEFAGEIRLAKKGMQRRCAGESYHLSASSIHRIVLPQTGITCSLVLRGPRLRRYSTVFNTDYPACNTQFENKMFSGLELRRRLAELLNVVGTNGRDRSASDVTYRRLWQEGLHPR